MGRVFVRYYVELPLAAERVEAALLHDPAAWVPMLAGRANERGEFVLAAVGFGELARFEKHVQLAFEPPVRMRSKTVLPMRWGASGPNGLFPALDADMEVAALGSSVTQLSVSARYRPPLGVLGRIADRAVLHRVAEATVKDFLDGIGDALTAVLLRRHSESRPAG